eukprot:5442882-Ditylum_brightwellii.AAC.1
MKSAYEWCKEGVFKVLGKEDRASDKDSLLLSASKGEEGRGVRVSFEEKLVSLQIREGDCRWEYRVSSEEKPGSHFEVLGKEDRASGKDGLLLSASKGEGGREDRASFKEKP